jgi:hypothetical protein
LIQTLDSAQVKAWTQAMKKTKGEVGHNFTTSGEQLPDSKDVKQLALKSTEISDR